MNELTKVNRERPTITIENRMIKVVQGDNAIYMTKNDVNNIRMLAEGRFEGTCTSNIEPRTRYTLLKDGSILATCRNEAHNDVVFISPKTMRFITQIRDNNRQKLAWDKDFKRRIY